MLEDRPKDRTNPDDCGNEPKAPPMLSTIVPATCVSGTASGLTSFDDAATTTETTIKAKNACSLNRRIKTSNNVMPNTSSAIKGPTGVVAASAKIESTPTTGGKCGMLKVECSVRSNRAWQRIAWGTEFMRPMGGGQEITFVRSVNHHCLRRSGK